MIRSILGLLNLFMWVYCIFSFGGTNPIWLSHPVHVLTALPMITLSVATFVKTFGILFDMVPDRAMYKWAMPSLWLIFFGSAFYYIGLAAGEEYKITAYDLASLIPFLLFAIPDFAYSLKLWKPRQK